MGIMVQSQQSAEKPQRPKYNEAWDIDILENYIAKISPPTKNQKKIREYWRDRVVLLLSIQCLKRSSDIAKLTLNSFDANDNRFKIFDMKGCKNSWSQWFYYGQNTDVPDLCLVYAIQVYLRVFGLCFCSSTDPFIRSIIKPRTLR
eukprot:TRINITY_DN8371_c0_g1_i1.p1 TRINITY_DN8371_c0_g1~~TRINITY_DN8371_c0_g1_i1.p1  ORF type:complete len:146 (+),score=5.67 TRINITY_DN8371_c0_g1_i1:86-523(+)